MKLFLSSAENSRKDTGFFQLRNRENKYWLYSYLYLAKKNEEEILTYLSVKGEVFLDSGAHTLQKPNNTIDWDKFVNDYIDFVNKYSQYIKYFVELDIENKVGLTQVEKWTDLIHKKTGRQPISVWHRERGFDYYKFMTKKFDYVGFSGFVEDKTGDPEVPDRFIPLFCKTAHDNGAMIHAFGYTRSGINKFEFDSVDSSTWKMVLRFGDIAKFNGERMVKMNSARNYKDDYVSLADWSVNEWIKYQKYLDAIPLPKRLTKSGTI